jgi:hypothetical protein
VAAGDRKFRNRPFGRKPWRIFFQEFFGFHQRVSGAGKFPLSLEQAPIVAVEGTALAGAA